MRNLAVIPARGGSKRIPKKNIKEFLGKPIIAYPIEVALKSGLFEEVMVSTDDAEIAKVAKKYGAKVPFMRTKENSNDFAPLSTVIDEVMSQYETDGQEFDNICCILPTAVMVEEELIRKGLQLLAEGGFHSVRPVVRYSYPIQRALTLDTFGRIAFLSPVFSKTRSQDLEPSFHDSGTFYWMKSHVRMNGELKGAFEISELVVQDIDNDVDFRLAELKYQVLHSSKP